VSACPTAAIRLTPIAWSIDAGACVFCGACARACPRQAITLGSVVELASDDRTSLVIERPLGERR
jgi:formate hydrogenlyase subunit 6/NADH:ubiquinone oxidoreductase subunit I